MTETGEYNSFKTFQCGDLLQFIIQLQGMSSKVLTQSTGKRFRFEFGAHMIPHPQKQAKGGEDALITKSNLLVIADGVGGWAQHGIDSGLYSKTLCYMISGFYDSNPGYYTDHPDELLKYSVAHNPYQGSSTITVITLNEVTGKMKIAYFGDSLTSVYSNGRKFKTQEHTHGFNQPYQVGMQGDDLNSCVKEQKTLVEGDLVLTGSDGVWDNLYDQEIQSIIPKNKDLKSLAKKLCVSAYHHSSDQNYNSPFASKAGQNGVHYMGGKPDDITLIAARVVRN